MSCDVTKVFHIHYVLVELWQQLFFKYSIAICFALGCPPRRIGDKGRGEELCPLNVGIYRADGASDATGYLTRSRKRPRVAGFLVGKAGRGERR
jgi:hypothetical protein